MIVLGTPAAIHPETSYKDLNRNLLKRFLRKVLRFLRKLLQCLLQKFLRKILQVISNLFFSYTTRQESLHPVLQHLFSMLQLPKKLLIVEDHHLLL